MRRIGGMIAHILGDMKDESRQTKVRAEISELCKQFPLYEMQE